MGEPEFTRGPEHHAENYVRIGGTDTTHTATEQCLYPVAPNPHLKATREGVRLICYSTSVSEVELAWSEHEVGLMIITPTL